MEQYVQPQGSASAMQQAGKHSKKKKLQIVEGKGDHILEMAMRGLNVTGEQI